MRASTEMSTSFLPSTGEAAQPEAAITIAKSELRALLKSCRGNEQRAKESLVSMAERDRSLMRALAELGAERALDVVHAEDRRTVLRSAGRQLPDNDAACDRERQGANTSLYNFRLHNGVLLGNAKHKDLVSQRSVFAVQADSMARRSNWMMVLEERMRATPNTMVRKVLSEDQIKAAAKKAGIEF